MIELKVSHDGITQTFDDWDELQFWIAKERSNWDWVNKVDGRPNSFAQYHSNQWANVFNQVASDRSNNVKLENAQNRLAPLTNGSIYHSQSAQGLVINDLRESFGDVTAVFAYAFLQRQIQFSDIRTVEQFRGVLIATMPNLEEPADIQDRLTKERANYRSSLSRSNQEIEAWQRERDHEWASFRHRAQKLGFASLRKAREQAKERMDGFTQSSNDAVSSLKETESAYRDFMGLRAPVDYWKTKASEHATNRDLAAKAMAAYFALLMIVLAIVFYQAASFVDANDKPITLYVLISAAIAVLSTIGFWIGRIVTKLYLSEHHLKIDADERAIMTQTYLSLKESGDATDSERQLILAALFRGSQDGIVADDGPPDLAMQAVAAKIISGQK